MAKKPPSGTYLYRPSLDVGDLFLSFSEEGLSSLRFVDPKGLLVETKPAGPHVEKALLWLDLYFEGKDPGFLPPLDIKGTPFQRTVYEALLKVPYGKTISYKSLGEMVSLSTHKPCASQAIGQALKKNPIPIIVPCHRVIGSNGSLTGYAYGLDRKKALLSLEVAL